MIKFALGIVAFAISASTWAFMPANGIWQIDSETNGQPGRGFTLDIENEVMFFTYYGYRSDGSNLFYVAAGPIVNNTFTGDLLNVQGGTSLGATYQPATLATSPGKVTLSFTSGKHGTMTLPGESPKAISKNTFGYADGPDGLLGTWLMAAYSGSVVIGYRLVLNTKTGQTTMNGNGMVITSNQVHVCEFQISGTLAGMTICANTLNSDAIAFKFSGDRGTGFIISGGQTYELHALRIATRTGAETGLNNGTAATLQIKSATISSMSKPAAADLVTTQEKEFANANQTSSALDPEKAAAIVAWRAEVSSLLAPKN